MNLLLVDPTEVNADGRVRLHDRRADHIRKVLRSRVGDVLKSGILDGAMGPATVVAIDDSSVELQLDCHLPPPERPQIDVLLAMPRPKVLRRVVQAATQLGIDRLVLCNAWRVEKAYFDSPLTSPEALAEEVRLGLEQARDTRGPRIQIERLLVPFLEGPALELWADAPCRLVAHPVGGRPLRDLLPKDSTTKVVLAIGPEGGWIEPELQSLQRAGFSPLDLGPRIWKVEVALAAAVGSVVAGRVGEDTDPSSMS